ncbi:MAG: ThiF family adenylyltransferase [Tissierellaceae bacterium]
MERYLRNFTSISRDQQEILAKSTVAIVGLGGLGGYVLENLVRLGLLNFHLIDMDVFEVSNLNRQLLSTEDNLGRPKVEAAYERARAINKAARARLFNARLDKGSFEMLKGVDLVIDCLDSIGDRMELEDLCDRMDLALVHGAIRGYYGQVSLSTREKRIYKKIYGECTSDEESLGNLPMTCMVTASFQVNLALSYLFGEKVSSELIFIDVKEMEIERLPL